MSAPEQTGFRAGARRVFREAVRIAQLPRLDVRLVTAPPTTGPADTDAAASRVADVLRVRMAELGVPGVPVVQVALEPGAEFPRLHIAGQPCRIPQDRLAAALAPTGPVQGADGDDDDQAGADWPTEVATACQVAVEWDPSVVIGPPQRAALVSAVRKAGMTAHAPDVLGAALQAVVANGVSCRDTAAVVRVLETAQGGASTDAELAEVLIAGLSPGVVLVGLPQRLLREMTRDEVDPETFSRMRVRLYEELGLRVPDIDIRIDPRVPDGCCTVRLHHTAFRPQRLPEPVTIEALAAAVESRVREHAWWFVHLDEVHSTVDQVRLALPELVGAVTDRYSEVQLAVLARTLLAEAVPLRNPPRLMVLLLDVPAMGSGRDVVRLAEPHRSEPERPAPRPSPGQVLSYARQQVLEERTRTEPGLRDVVVDQVPDRPRAGNAGALHRGRPADTPPGFVNALLEQAARAVGSEWGLVAASQAERDVAHRLLHWQYPEVAVRVSQEFPPTYRLRPRPTGPVPAADGTARAETSA
ncbi:hypothetical protein SAMN05660642_01678 [Geodermatophilus siccatus]|uniref:Uncharacterized protein n=1 Tax=Geodermatophilus siccatus TaxID=1137991 RepID=A0A1G9QJ14_9ACTN|nr:hypothetical protein [Geodermatophilus siccatus]SDM10507.1 hypothetical protein SAMN05660642_01678 [Geodermatophilus siccatus]